METLTYSGTLVIVKCWCGVRHAVPQELYDEAKRVLDNNQTQDPIFCPLGHKWYIAGESKAVQLEKQLARERAAHDQTRAALRTEKNKVNSQKAATSRLRNRVGNGVCPCCNRSFANVRRHMESQHPDFAGEALKGGK